MRTLIVEDHPDCSIALARLLRRMGHEVRAAATAEEALRACGEESFDLLISDIGLPDMTGWALLRRVRERCAVPAIALTAYGSPADEERSRAAGFQVHLSKPVDIAALKAAVSRFAGPAGTALPPTA